MLVRRVRLLSAALVACLVVAACNDDAPKVEQSSATTDPSTTSTPGTDSPGTDPPGTDPVDAAPEIDWQPFDGAGSLEEATLVVPMDYDDPSKGSFELYLMRRPADDQANRIGSLLVNPGGPGFGGTILVEFADAIYGEQLLERFDIVAWDPRGTGRSEPAIDCVDEYDPYFASVDITPDDDAERQQVIDVAREFQEACVTKNAEFIEYIGTNNSARDMDTIRRALGEEQISYFGFSYGSELGATWATLFPETVRAAVLDGASDPTAGFFDAGLQQAAGFEGTLTTFLAQCSADPGCAFHNGGDAEGAFDQLMEAIDETPVPTTDGRPPVTRGVALTGVAQAMYSQALWSELAEALASAEQGDGRGLLSLYDQYFQRQADGTYDNSLEAFQSIYCMDAEERPSVEEEDAMAEEFRNVAPRYAPNTTGSYFCSFFPPSIDPRVPITGRGAGPILVMGTTGDAATPLESTRAMARALEDGRLVIVVADQHTGYGVNQCSYDVIDDYLVDPVNNAPADGTRCE